MMIPIRKTKSKTPSVQVLGHSWKSWIQQWMFSPSIQHWMSSQSAVLSASLYLLHIHIHSLSPVLVGMIKSKELKTKIYSHAHSLILACFVGAYDLALASCKPYWTRNEDATDSNEDEIEQLLDYMMAQMIVMIEKLRLRSAASSRNDSEILLEKAKDYVHLALAGTDVYTLMLVESVLGEDSCHVTLYKVNS